MFSRKATAATQKPMLWCLRDRGRGATDEDKRSALITLAGILEERRQLIKAELVP